MPTPIPSGAPGADAVRAPAADLQAEAGRIAERVRREASEAVAPERIDSEPSLLNRFAEHEDVAVVVGPVLAEIVAAALLAEVGGAFAVGGPAAAAAALVGSVPPGPARGGSPGTDPGALAALVGRGHRGLSVVAGPGLVHAGPPPAEVHER